MDTRTRTCTRAQNHTHTHVQFEETQGETKAGLPPTRAGAKVQKAAQKPRKGAAKQGATEGVKLGGEKGGVQGKGAKVVGGRGAAAKEQQLHGPGRTRASKVCAVLCFVCVCVSHATSRAYINVHASNTVTSQAALETSQPL